MNSKPGRQAGLPRSHGIMESHGMSWNKNIFPNSHGMSWNLKNPTQSWNYKKFSQSRIEINLKTNKSVVKIIKFRIEFKNKLLMKSKI